ncbi:MAG TPA: hypothetical protein PLQ00_07660, partial [Thermoguttaceae bacterium]|nr:hypothetical protein [Thermoguttaceae bacterium]
ARTGTELAAELKALLPQASEQEFQAALAARTEELRRQGLLIEEWDLDRIGADLSRCGAAGSPTKVWRVQGIVLTRKVYKQYPATEEGVRELIHELVVDRTLG